ncbi:MAG TPA: hypothetical protein VL354_10970 [Spirochaetia bacterium]|nr:hypothetical protein [Spirochaetia bacterium]
MRQTAHHRVVLPSGDDPVTQAAGVMRAEAAVGLATLLFPQDVRGTPLTPAGPGRW